MASRIATSIVIAILSAGAGCRRQSELPPQFAADLSGGLLPVRVTEETAKRSIVGQAASKETPAAAGGATGGTVVIDDSTPEAAIKSFAALLEAGEIARLPDLLVPEQQEFARKAAGAMQPLMDVTNRLKAALDAKFPGHAIQLGGQGAPGSEFAKRVQVMSVEVINDNEARATLQAEGQPQTETVSLRREGNAWRIQDPDLEAPTGPEAEMAMKMMDVFPKIAEGFEGVLAQIENGQITDAQAAEQAIQQAAGAPAQEMLGDMMKQMGEEMAKSMGQPDDTQQSPPPDEEQPAENNPPPPGPKKDAPENDPLQMAPGRYIGL